MKVPTGNTKEDIEARKKIISDFYYKWYEEHPHKKVYNINLKDDINIRFISVNETSRHAAKTYLSTLAVLQLDAILATAKRFGVSKKPKKGVKNQEGFSEIIEMRCNLTGIGIVKLIVGVKKTNRMKVQYCITVLQTK